MFFGDGCMLQALFVLVDTKLFFGFVHIVHNVLFITWFDFCFNQDRFHSIFRPLWQVLEVQKWVRRRWKQYCCYHRVTSQWKSESSLHEDWPFQKLNWDFWWKADLVAIVCLRFPARVRQTEVLQCDFHCVDAIRESFSAQGSCGALRGPFLIHTHS